MAASSLDVDIEFFASEKEIPVRIEAHGYTTIQTVFSFPFQPEEVWCFLNRKPPPSSEEQLHFVREKGRLLYKAFFTGKPAEWFAAIGDQDHICLRLKYTLEATNGVNLHNMPWEWLHNGTDFLLLSQHPKLTIARKLDECPSKPIDVLKPMLLWLAHVDGNPTTRMELAQLEQFCIDQLGHDGRPLHMRRLEDLPEGLNGEIRQAFHFIGHGRFSTERGMGDLLLTDTNRRNEIFVSANVLGERLGEAGDFCLAVLNCCQGVRSSPGSPFSDLAPALLKAQIPIVVAMYDRISHENATAFSKSFYRKLAMGSPVDLAVRAGRLAIRKENTVARLLPCLFQQSAKGNLFPKRADSTKVWLPNWQSSATESKPERIIEPWVSFEEWLNTDDAPIYGSHDMISCFGLSVLAREWFRLYVDGDLEAGDIETLADDYQVAWFHTLECDRVVRHCFLCIPDPHILATVLGKKITGVAENDGLPVSVAVGVLDGPSYSVVEAAQKTINEQALPLNLKRIFMPPKKEKQDEEDISTDLEPKSVRPSWLDGSYFEKLKNYCIQLDPVLEKAHNYKLSITQAVHLELLQRGEFQSISFEKLDTEPKIADRSVIITGQGGSGKTTLLKQWLHRRLENDGPLRPTPVLLPLRFYRPGRLVSLLVQLGVLPGHVQEIQNAANWMARHLWLVALDGYDELVDKASFWQEWSVLASPSIRVLITSRELADLERQLLGAPVIRVCKLSISQLNHMVKEYEGKQAAKVISFINLQRLESEARLPLWLLFIMLLHRIPKLKKLSDVRKPGEFTKGLLFQVMIEHFFFNWEKDRKSYQIENERKLAALADIAFAMHRMGKVSADYHELLGFIAGDSRHADLDAGLLLSELLGHQLLNAECGMYSFPHKSFLEFFAGRRIKEQTIVDLGGYREENWLEPLKYTIGILDTGQAANILHNDFKLCGFQHDGTGFDGFQFVELISQIKGFRKHDQVLDTSAQQFRNRLGKWLHHLVQKLPHLPKSELSKGRHGDIELGIKVACLFPPNQAVALLEHFLDRTQNIRIQAIDLLGAVADEKAVTLLLDKVMTSSDERILRRVTDNGLRPRLLSGGRFAEWVLEAIWARIVHPGALSQTGFLKRRWHLLHLLVELNLIETERLNVLPEKERDICKIYLYLESDFTKAVQILCATFAKSESVDEAVQRRALRHLLNEECFFMRRVAALFLRRAEFDMHEAVFQTAGDPRIEVRLSSLKGILALVERYPKYLLPAQKILLEAIRNHPEKEEEHFRQVALGALKNLDYDGFCPLAIEALENEDDIFKVDMIQDLKFATGFWRRAAINRLEYWQDAGSNPVRDAAAYVNRLLQ